MTTFRFNVAEVFPTDDLLSEWVATLAVAFNDLALVHERMEHDAETPHRFFYWLRLAIAHYSEAADYLAQTRAIPEVEVFVQSLPPETRARYETCLDLYEARESEIHQIRNLAAFHYPELRAGRRTRPMKAALEAFAATGEPGRVKRGQVRQARMLFADDLMSFLFVRSTPTWPDAEALHHDIERGIDAFMRFTNPAIEEFFLRAQGRGALFIEEPDASGNAMETTHGG
jgi:hypothetical protein